MRIPIFITLPACILTVFVVWWITTHEIDFLTPPSETQLELIHTQAIASLPLSRTQQDAISVVVPIPDIESLAPEQPELLEPIEIGELTPPTALDTYSDRAPEGAQKLLRLATELEKKGAFQRSLLAYERVLDLSQANPEQIQDALLAIRRIRPTLVPWNQNPELSHKITIRIGTGQKFADILPGIMDSICQELKISSSGLIQFNYQLNIGRSIHTTNAPTPVALWMTGSDRSTPSTDVLSFTTDDPETLRNDLLKTLFNLTRGQLAKATSYNPAPEATGEPKIALSSNITRLLWDEFGKSLNPQDQGQ